VGRNSLIVGNILVAAAYYLMAQVGFAVSITGSQSSQIWFASGVAVAGIMLFGYRVLPGIWIGACLANWSYSGLWWQAAFIANGNTTEAFLCVWLMRLFLPFYSVAWSYLIATVTACQVSAGNGPIWLIAFGMRGVDEFYMLWLDWWVGDMIGCFSVLPLVVMFNRGGDGGASWLQQQTLRISSFLFLLLAASSFLL
jgi:integral membrane sensor domain MASE1